MKLKDGEVLIPCGDHGYRIGDIVNAKAVWSEKHYEWKEYVGDSYLEEGDVVLDVMVAQ